MLFGIAGHSDADFRMSLTKEFDELFRITKAARGCTKVLRQRQVTRRAMILPIPALRGLIKPAFISSRVASSAWKCTVRIRPNRF